MIACTGCSKNEASHLECPNCRKLGIQGSYFCDQECFKRSWGSHKLVHSIVKAASQAESDKNSSIPASMKDYKFTGPLRPQYPLSPKRVVPDHIPRPDYADHPQGQSLLEVESERGVKCLTPVQIEGMRKVCRLSREVLDIVASHIRPGITTDELDRICHEECLKRDAYPSPLNYNGFPKSICTSINECIAHGIPDQRELVEGDIINLDVSLYYGGLHGDVNATYPVGEVDKESSDLMETTKYSMNQAIAMCKPGVAFREIGNTIEGIVKPKGYGIVRRYTAHGVDYMFHCQPWIVHYGGSKMPGRMEAGQVFTIEPMINLGTANLDHWKDGWTAVTMDGRRSAQFEETILITDTGAEILTRPSASSAASKKKKQKKKKSQAAKFGTGELDGDDDGDSGTTTPVAQETAAMGVP